MPTKSFTVVSLFTGAGGLDIGLEQAGFSTVVAVDNEPDCVQTLWENQQARLGAGNGTIHLDRAALVLSGVENLDPSNLRPPSVHATWVPDLMAGGPPCQPFSSSGKMLSVSDPRGRLFEHFVRLAAEAEAEVDSV